MGDVVCCGSDGVTYSSPCAAPAGVDCVDYNECPAGCIKEDGIVYWGHDIPGGRKTTADSQECADFSASLPGGLYWSFRKSSKTCYVKSSNSGRRTDGDAVSGNRKCANPGIISDCSTTGGNAGGRECKFPFIYKGVTYNTCTSLDNNQPWCYTDGKKWGNCLTSCQG